MSETKQEQQNSPQRNQLLEIPGTTSLERRLLVNNESKPKPNITSIRPSPLLGTLQQFLPQLQKSNLELEKEEDQRRMEQVGGDEAGPYVELDLACGLFDLKDDAAVEAAERALINTGVVVETFDGGSSDDSSDEDTDSEDGDGDNSDEEMDDGEQPSQPSKPASTSGSPSKTTTKKKKKHAGIEELN